MKHTKLTAQDLKQALTALRYEVSMFQSLEKGLASGITGKSVIGNALLESFLLHVRVLVDFFYNDRPREDDIIAECFFLPSSEWKKIRPPKSKTLVDAKTRADKLLAHLTYTRLSSAQETKKWDFIAIANEIEEVLRVFYENLPADFTKESNI